jgi:hypothetical protein
MVNKKMFRGAMLVVALTGMVMTTPTSVQAEGQEKFTICHVPPGNPENAQTITVAFPALVAHFANHGGDSFGECGSEGGE